MLNQVNEICPLIKDFEVLFADIYPSFYVTSHVSFRIYQLLYLANPLVLYLSDRSQSDHGYVIRLLDGHDLGILNW